jgi:transcriptional regulator with GAF, ATPase, and Fis domain
MAKSRTFAAGRSIGQLLPAGPILHLQRAALWAENMDSVPIETLPEPRERAHIMAALRETNWVIGGGRGAARLGLARTTLVNMMQRHGIPRDS